ncbi:MAG: UDP-N-acetylenolpyruvoylglucosamine reductase, partial [Lysobacter sp.]|nr:UDP-N-acetylenolpyruvoylglucosamine reductase [Lysobacter sp.]
MSADPRIVRDADLRHRNTFGVAARAPWLVSIDDAAALPQALRTGPLNDGI